MSASFMRSRLASVADCPETAPVAAGPAQLPFLTVFKGLAAQLIVLHHLAYYGPMSDHVRPVAPLLVNWLDAYARLAVQVFLVIGGFLAARSLASDGMTVQSMTVQGRTVGATIARRYLALAPPFIVAIVLTVGASALARSWMSHDSISAAPTLPQLAAHALLLQDVLGYEALSAGAWYVAIDFQLYALFALLVWFCSSVARTSSAPATRIWLLPAVVILLMCSSLFWFNRDERFDVSALYFFGSYGLGALACWVSAAPGRRQQLLALALLAPAIVALVLDFRIRIALALLAAGLIAWAAQQPQLPQLRERTAPLPLLWLGRIAYPVFLVHFGVCLVVNAMFIRLAPATAGWQGTGMLVAWAASVAAGAVFHRLVEAPISRLLTPARASAMSAPAAPTPPSN